MHQTNGLLGIGLTGYQANELSG